MAGMLLAAAILTAAAYVLGWRIFWDGPVGSDALYHLHLVTWVANTFPGIDWWYRWDAGGLSYREGYPLAAHWLTAAVAQLAGLALAQAMQVVQFAINPLCALGVYAFCAVRLKRPLAGVVAGLLYLLSPMTWTFLVDWGFYANQAGTVLFMPVLIAVDILFHQWLKGARGWAYRLSALAVMGLGAIMGMIAPSFASVPIVVALAYGLAIRTGWKVRARWLLVATPVIAVGSLLLAAFWALPLRDYLALVASREPARVYGPSLFSLVGLDQVLGLSGLRPSHVEDRMSLTPVVWLPALAGGLYAVWEPRIRAFLALMMFGLVSMTWYGFYAATYGLLLANYLLTFRSGMLYLQFLTPILAGLGLTAVPTLLGDLALRRFSIPLPARRLAAAGLVGASLGVGAVGVAAFSERVSGYPHGLAYGPFALDSRDIWKHHQDDECVLDRKKDTPLCRSQALSTAFSVAELINGCRDPGGGLRRTIPICAALKDIDAPGWDAGDDPLIVATQHWCAQRDDPVCAARYLPAAEQLLDVGRWRPFRLDCLSATCTDRAGVRRPYDSLSPSAPDRAVLDAHVPQLLMAFHDLAGGGQSYAYAFQLVPSPELAAWMLDGMLERAGTAVKAQLAALSGADAVVLAGTQTARAPDYERLGWRRVNEVPVVLVPPHPTGLAAEWPGGNTVLVVGASQNAPSHPYNDVFKWATQGMIPFADAWLVRGRSAYIDDYSDDDLSKHPVLLLLGYRYHDRQRAWERLDRFVSNGGRLYIETGWQYVDPDWKSLSGPAALPARDLRWGTLDPRAPLLVNGQAVTGWGAMSYAGSGWGASSAASVPSGAEPLVQVGDRVVVARWTHGNGRVLWSGMNLLAHAHGSHSQDEETFVADQWQWLLPRPPRAQAVLEPRWLGNDVAELALDAASGPVRVLFKESAAPGWSAQLRWPGGERQVRTEPAEMDYMLVSFDSVPAGAQLVFRYGPTWRVVAAWATSLLALGLLLAWLVRPAIFQPVGKRVRRWWDGGRERVQARLRWDEDET